MHNDGAIAAKMAQHIGMMLVAHRWSNLETWDTARLRISLEMYGLVQRIYVGLVTSSAGIMIDDCLGDDDVRRSGLQAHQSRKWATLNFKPPCKSGGIVVSRRIEGRNMYRSAGHREAERCVLAFRSIA
jgi:hypothetical protein